MVPHVVAAASGSREAFAPPVKDWAALHAFVSAVMVQGAEARDAFKPREQTQLAV